MRGIVALSIGYSAYMAEIFRAGIEAVPKGPGRGGAQPGPQGLAGGKAVMLPQALRVIIPPLGNEFIAILKDTSLLTLLSVRDVTAADAGIPVGLFPGLPPYNTVAIFYVLLTLSVGEHAAMERASLQCQSPLKFSAS